jgi:CubicO group peptidase (beta-lactamase class C family)
LRAAAPAGSRFAYSDSASSRSVRWLKPLDGARILPANAVDQLTTPHVIGDSVRALGWDMRARYSGLRGDRMSAHAFGHAGFTGTSLWIDPDRDLFVDHASLGSLARTALFGRFTPAHRPTRVSSGSNRPVDRKRNPPASAR